MRVRSTEADQSMLEGARFYKKQDNKDRRKPRENKEDDREFLRHRFDGEK